MPTVYEATAKTKANIASKKGSTGSGKTLDQLAKETGGTIKGNRVEYQVRGDGTKSTRYAYAGGDVDLTPTPKGGRLPGESGGDQSAAETPTGVTTPQGQTPTETPTPQGAGEVSYEEATKNLQAGGLTGGTLTMAQKNLDTKYGRTLQSLQGTAAPSSYGEAMSGISSTQTYEPDTSGVDSFLTGQPLVDGLFKQILGDLDPKTQTSTLMQDYKKLYKSSGLDEINEELIDAETVINGTEDDIRNEIQTAGGFGTDSQIQALALSRNKNLLKRYNALAQMQTNAQRQLDTMMQLSAQDKQMAQQQMQNRISNMFNLANFAQQAQNNIREQARWNTEFMGADGVYNALKNDPKQLANYEKVMGMPNGSLAVAAVHAAEARDLENRYKNAQIANIYDQIDARSSGGITVTNPKYAGVVQTILGSGKFTKEQSQQIANAINNGDDPLTVVRNQAKNIMGQTQATDVTKYETAKSAMEDLQSALAEYYANGGKTNILSGNYEKVVNNLGTVNDPKLVDLAVQIQSSLQVYRNAVSGTAYSVQEGKDIASIFPGINKTQGLNDAIISGRLKAFDSTINGVYESTLGSSTYQSVVSASGGKGNLDSRTYVENVLSGLGLNYDVFVSQAKQGEIPVIHNATGMPGYILPGEYNSTTYTRI